MMAGVGLVIGSWVGSFLVGGGLLVQHPSPEA